MSKYCKNVLILAFTYPPKVSPRAFRWESIIDEWVARSIDCDLVTGPVKGLQAIEKKGHLTIYRTGIPLIKGTPSFKVDSSSNHTSIYAKVAGYFLFLIKKGYDVTWKLFYWPDYACLWYFFALFKGISLLRKNKYDAIVSVSLPFTAHLVGWALKKLFKLDQWYIDIGDPFYLSKTNNGLLYARINRFMEKVLLLSSRRIFLPSLGMKKKYYLDLSPSLKEKIIVIPPILSINNAKTTKHKRVSLSDFKSLDRTFAEKSVNRCS